LRTIHIALAIALLSAAVLGSAIYWDKSIGSFMNIPSSSKTTFIVSVNSNTTWTGTVAGLPKSGSGSENFTVQDSSTSACFQQLGFGYVTVTISKNGQVEDSQTTNQPYDTMAVSVT